MMETLRAESRLMRRVIVALAWAGLVVTAIDARAQDASFITPAAEAEVVSHPDTQAAGAAAAAVTIVEWFDYNCPYCRKTHSQVQQLLRNDPHVRVLYKEWPIFGDVSDYAARAALAAKWQNKYLIAHDALLGTAQPLENTSEVDSVLQAAGIDLALLRRHRTAHAAEIDSILARADREARMLDLRGTPAFLIGRQFVARSLTLAQLEQLVNTNARRPMRY
jgi:protein-disulfide isomerase